MAKKSNGAFPPKLTLQLEEMSDRFKWLSQKKPRAAIWTPGIATPDDTPEKRNFINDANQSEVGLWYQVGCFLNSDLAHSRLFIFSNRRFISDLTLEAIDPGPRRNLATNFFLLRMVLETWAAYLDGLISISSLPSRPSKLSWDAIREFQNTNVTPIKFLNASSRLNTEKDWLSEADIQRKKDDPMRAENILQIMQRHAHLVADYERVYDICCHVVHPSSAIRELYATRSSDPSLGYSRITATDKPPIQPEKETGMEKMIVNTLTQCEKVIRGHEKKAETHLQKLEKAQIKINRRIGKDITRDHPDAHLLPCICGSEKTVPQCCGRRAASPSP